MSVNDNTDTPKAELEVRCAPGGTCGWYSYTLQEAALARMAGDDRTARQLRSEARDHLSSARRRGYGAGR